MTLTMSSSSRHRNIMSINEWLENQESWLEAFVQVAVQSLWMMEWKFSRLLLWKA